MAAIESVNHEQEVAPICVNSLRLCGRYRFCGEIPVLPSCPINLEAEITQTWVFVRTAPERPMIFTV